MKAFASWSGGKESALACYRAMNEGMKVSYLVNMVSVDGLRSHSHGVSSEILRRQAQAIEIPLLQQRASWETYEENFKKIISELKQKGTEAGVFGDIDLQVHRDWVERVTGEMRLKAILPLWGEERVSLCRDFIHAGFKAIIVSVNITLLKEDLLGRIIDEKFLKEIQQLKHVDICGEKGEYHTLVIDGPIFRKPFRIKSGKIIQQKERALLEIKMDY